MNLLFWIGVDFVSLLGLFTSLTALYFDTFIQILRCSFLLPTKTRKKCTMRLRRDRPMRTLESVNAKLNKVECFKFSYLRKYTNTCIGVWYAG